MVSLIFTANVVLCLQQLYGCAMNEPSNESQADSLVDAKAIFCLIVLVVAFAVFWVSQQ